jgi:hypothetical protein
MAVLRKIVSGGQTDILPKLGDRLVLALAPIR